MLRALAFYLPQYHPIRENNAWWGEGFTEWTNVAKARPRFRGHHQPQIPADLGFYDLRLPETRAAQARMAQDHGIDGFLYYHYWFNGQLLLERPAADMLKMRQPDHQFCFDWANENWTRTWGGEDQQILMKQDYETYDARAHIEWLAPYFNDDRYIRVGGRPLWAVHVPARLPAGLNILEQWRHHARAIAGSDLYICGVMGPHRLAPDQIIASGFDAAIEFYPKFDRAHRSRRDLVYLPQRAWNALADRLDPDGRRLKRAASLTEMKYPLQVAESAGVHYADGVTVHPTVFPSWDNCARRRYRANVYQNDDPALYGRWLAQACERAARHAGDEQLVFINAWNEWGEGCHLEPDTRNGRMFLEETARILKAHRAAKG